MTPSSNKSILLLEDQPLISLDLEEALRDIGIDHVQSLRSQREALDWLEDNSPDAVILDLHLEDGDGRGVMEILRKRTIPVIVYSGSQKPDDWQSDLFRDCEWVEKPSDSAQIAVIAKAKLREGSVS
jgi:CheY-like chemotaxis protein